MPTATVEFLAERVAVRPGVRALAQTQDRLTEKTFLRDLGLKTAPFAKVEDAGALVRAESAPGSAREWRGVVLWRRAGDIYLYRSRQATMQTRCDQMVQDVLEHKMGLHGEGDARWI